MTRHRLVKAMIDWRLWADEEDGAAVTDDLVHLAQATLLEFHIADGENFIDNEDLGLKVGRHGKSQPDVHTGRITLHRGVEELLDLGEGHNFVEFAIDLGPFHPQDRAVEVDVLAASQLIMKPGADLEE